MNMHRSQPKLCLTVKQLSIHASAKHDPETNLSERLVMLLAMPDEQMENVELQTLQS